MNWREIQMFLLGFYICATAVTLMFIYFELGTINQRMFLSIMLIIGYGTLPLLTEKSTLVEGEKK